MDRATEDIENVAPVIERAIEHTVERLERFPRLRQVISRPRLEANPETHQGICLIPQADGQSGCVILFSPEYIRQLSREHRHPEWVVSACLERQVLKHADRWSIDENERAALAAHAEKRAARRPERKSDDGG